jgi:hypothetical protein
MFLRGLAMLLRGLGVSLSLVVVPLFVMMGRLVLMVSRGLMCRCCVVMMLVRRMLGHADDPLGLETRAAGNTLFVTLIASRRPQEKSPRDRRGKGTVNPVCKIADRPNDSAERFIPSLLWRSDQGAKDKGRSEGLERARVGPVFENETEAAARIDTIFWPRTFRLRPIMSSVVWHSR